MVHAQKKKKKKKKKTTSSHGEQMADRIRVAHFDLNYKEDENKTPGSRHHATNNKKRRKGKIAPSSARLPPCRILAAKIGGEDTHDRLQAQNIVHYLDQQTYLTPRNGDADSDATQKDITATKKKKKKNIAHPCGRRMFNGMAHPSLGIRVQRVQGSQRYTQVDWTATRRD